MTNRSPNDILQPPSAYRPGWLTAIGARLSEGVATVVETIPSHARWWHQHNLAALAGSRPLWIALGDSTAQGVGATNPWDGYVGQLHRSMAAGGAHYDVVNLSVTGAVLADLLDQQVATLDRIVQAGRQPKLITATIGSNDILRSVNVARMTRQIEQAVTLLSDQADHATFGALLHRRGSRVGTAFNQALRATASANDATVAEVGKAMNQQAAGRSAWASDNFHPNEVGYNAFHDAFLAAVEPHQ